MKSLITKTRKAQYCCILIIIASAMNLSSCVMLKNVVDKKNLLETKELAKTNTSINHSNISIISKFNLKNTESATTGINTEHKVNSISDTKAKLIAHINANANVISNISSRSSNTEKEKNRLLAEEKYQRELSEVNYNSY